MLENPNPWKQYALLLVGALAGLISYLLSLSYSLADVKTAIFYTFDLYNQRIYVRMPLIALSVSIIGSLVAYGLLRLWKCIKKCQSKKQVISPQISEAEYERQGKELTQLELNKLVQSVQYKTELAKRGAEEKNWNWQTVERLERERKYKDDIRADLNGFGVDDNIS